MMNVIDLTDRMARKPPTSGTWNGQTERRAGMEELQRAVTRLEDQGLKNEGRLSKLEAGAVVTEALLMKVDSQVDMLVAAHNVSKGLKILGSLGLTTVAGAIGAALTTWFAKP